MISIADIDDMKIMSVLPWIFFQIGWPRPHIVSKFPDDVEQFQGWRAPPALRRALLRVWRPQQSRPRKQRMTLERRNPLIDRVHGKNYRLVINELNGQ